MLDWLVADFDVFGLRIQYWLPVMGGAFAIFIIAIWLDDRRSGK